MLNPTNINYGDTLSLFIIGNVAIICPAVNAGVKSSNLREKSAGEFLQRASQLNLFPTGGEGGIRTLEAR